MSKVIIVELLVLLYELNGAQTIHPLSKSRLGGGVRSSQNLDLFTLCGAYKTHIFLQ